MFKYKVKKMSCDSSEKMQSKIKHWIESRSHITLVSMNTWSDKDMVFSTIIYWVLKYKGGLV